MADNQIREVERVKSFSSCFGWLSTLGNCEILRWLVAKGRTFTEIIDAERGSLTQRRRPLIFKKVGPVAGMLTQRVPFTGGQQALSRLETSCR